MLTIFFDEVLILIIILSVFFGIYNCLIYYGDYIFSKYKINQNYYAIFTILIGLMCGFFGKSVIILWKV